MAVALLGLALASCSKDSKLLSRIPSDADLVAKIDMVKVYENAGCAVDGDKVTVSDQIVKMLFGNDSEESRFMTGFFESGAVNLRDVFMVVSFKAGDPVMLAEITDVDALEKCFAKGGLSAVKTDGWACWAKGTGSGAMFLQADNLLVMAGGDNPAAVAADVNKVLGGASDKPLSKCDWKCNELMASNTVNVVANVARIPYGMPFKNAVVGITLDGPKAVMTASCRDDDGELIDQSNGLDKYLSNINTSMLKYLNSYDMGVMAFGVKGDFPWKKAGEEMEKVQPGTSQMFAMVASYLQTLDGTTMIGFGPKKGLSSFMSANLGDFTEFWDLVLATELTEGSAEKYLTQIEGMVKMANDPSLVSERLADGTLKVSVEYMSFYGKADGNTLVVKTSPEATGAPTVDAAMIKGYNNMVAVRVPRESAVMTGFGIDFGADLKMWSSDAVGHAELLLTDTKQPLLKTIIDQIEKSAL